MSNLIAQIHERSNLAPVDPIVKTSLVETVASELRLRLDSVPRNDALPGVRQLARSLGVSVPTICRALHLLAEEGFLDGGGTRRRWRLAASGPGNDRSVPKTAPAAPGRSGAPGRMLFLAAQPLSDERESGVEVFAELLDQVGAKGWQLMYRVEKFSEAKKPRRSWDELLRLTRPDALVVLGGTPVLGHWAIGQGVRTLFVGGGAGDSGVPVLGVRVSTMLRQSLEHLLASGHKRIVLPVCARPPSFAARFREVALETTTTMAVDPRRVVILETPYARPEVMLDLLRKAWREKAPDALIFFDWREFIAASGFFQETGIRIPRDLSVVLLSKNASMDWHLPPITHFEYPVKLMARMISKWAVDGKSKLDSRGFVEVHARWMEGGSVRTRK